MKKILLTLVAMMALSSLQAQLDTMGKYPYLFYYNWPETGVMHDSVFCSIGLQNTFFMSALDYGPGDEVCSFALAQHTDDTIEAIGLAVGCTSFPSSLSTTEVVLYDSSMNELAVVSRDYAGQSASVASDTNAHHFYYPGHYYQSLDTSQYIDPTNFPSTYLYFDYFKDPVFLTGDFFIGFRMADSTLPCFVLSQPLSMFEWHDPPYHIQTSYRLLVNGAWSETKQMTTTLAPIMFVIQKLPCYPVDSVSVTLGSDGCLTADWEQPALQSAWTVKLTLPNGNEIIQPVDTNHWEYCGLATNQQYSLHVRSRCDDLNGHSWSDWGEGFTVSLNGIGSVQHAPDFTLTPNPASGTVTVGGFEGEGSVEIVDMAGRVSGQWPVAGGQRTIDISRLPAGSYVVRLTTAEGTASRMLQVE